jgi:hypothetical protein
LSGRYVHGHLRLEAGLHRVRGELGSTGTARVRVAPWIDATGPVVFGEHVALKAGDQLGGRVRSRLTCEGGLVLQSGRVLAAQRDFAIQVAPSWAAAPPSSDEVVRRYELAPLRVRDVITGESTGRSDALSGASLHRLLCKRVDLASDGQ